jgi:hypothetical protein
LALLYYPKDKVNQLAIDIKTPNAPLYNQDNALAGNLTNQINPAIPIWLGSDLEGNYPVPGSGNDSDQGSNNDAFGGSGGGKQTAAQMGTTAGIAVGALSVAGAYGAAMFIIARRYKRKKQRHQRSSSVSAMDEMRQAGSPALMGGALLSRDFSGGPGYGGYGTTNGGNMRNSQGSGRSGTNHSARTANISAPVAAENSLGWNWAWAWTWTNCVWLHVRTVLLFPLCYFLFSHLYLDTLSGSRVGPLSAEGLGGSGPTDTMEKQSGLSQPLIIFLVDYTVGIAKDVGPLFAGRGLVSAWFFFYLMHFNHT